MFRSKIKNASQIERMAELKSATNGVVAVRRPPDISAERLPQSILAWIFQYLPLADVGRCMRVCPRWHAYFAYEDSELWEWLARRILSPSGLQDPYLLIEARTWKSKLAAFKHAWNPLDVSKNAYVKVNSFTMHRNPVAQSTDGVRSKIGFNEGRHCWEVAWEGPLGTVALVGVATRHAALQCPSYLALLGSDEQGWGWNLVDNTLLHDGKALDTPYPYIQAPNGGPFKYQVGEKIRVVLDCESHMLYFEKDETFLGVAFDSLPPVKLFASICAVYGNTEVSMVYLGPPLDG